MLSPPRTSGDGMESGATSCSTTNCPLYEPAEQQMLKIITNQRLQGASLPDILGDLELASGVDQPIFRLTPAAEQRSAAHQFPAAAAAGSAVPAGSAGGGGAREARFVPYEPYPGCVSPLAAGPGAVVSPSVGSGRRRASGDNGEPSRAAAAAAVAAAAVADPEQEDVRTTKLRRERDELQRELNVAMEVTVELKKLLVASIGEDIESRLHLLSEDKAHLAQLVRTFSAQAAQEGEGRDQLSIQCDVWRSKFMACSLMVDELAGWKAVLGRRCRETEAALKSLLSERRQITEQLHTAARSLSAVREAFDPLSAQTGRRAPDGHALQLGGDVAQLSGTLHERLLGRPPAPAPAPPAPGQTPAQAHTPHQPRQSPAEQAAEKLLATSACYQYQAQRDSCKDRGMADRFHPQARLEHLTMTCCTHCSGDIYVV